MFKDWTTEQGMAEMWGLFLLKQSAFYGNVENILIFSSSELKIFIFASSTASTGNQNFSSKI